MRNFIHLVALAAIALVACEGCPPVNTHDPIGPRPTPVPVDTDLCDAAERHLAELGCAESRPTMRGQRFSDVCRELHAAGISVNPSCLMRVQTCAEVDVCTGTVAPR